jgi:hypothetical protein
VTPAVDVFIQILATESVGAWSDHDKADQFASHQSSQSFWGNAAACSVFSSRLSEVEVSVFLGIKSYQR